MINDSVYANHEANKEHSSTGELFLRTDQNNESLNDRDTEKVSHYSSAKQRRNENLNKFDGDLEISLQIERAWFNCKKLLLELELKEPEMRQHLHEEESKLEPKLKRTEFESFDLCSQPASLRDKSTLIWESKGKTVSLWAEKIDNSATPVSSKSIVFASPALNQQRRNTQITKARDFFLAVRTEIFRLKLEPYILKCNPAAVNSQSWNLIALMETRWSYLKRLTCLSQLLIKAWLLIQRIWATWSRYIQAK